MTRNNIKTLGFVGFLVSITMLFGCSNNQNNTTSTSENTSTIPTKIPVEVNVSYDGKGTILLLDTYYVGDTVVLNIEPDRGYYIAQVKLDGNRLSMNQGVYKFEATKNNYDLYVLFDFIETDSNDFSYRYNDDTLEAFVIGYKPTSNYIPDPLIIPDTTTYNQKTYQVVGIEKGGFASVDIKAIQLGKNITNLPDGPFDDLVNLKEIIVDENNPKYASENGVLLNKSKDTIIYNPIDRIHGELTIETQIKKIAPYAFSNNRNITSINIPSSVVEIGNYAFTYCAFLKTVSFPESIDVIPEGVCYHCHSLEEIQFNGNVERLSYLSFANCIGLKKFIAPNSLKYLDDFAVYDCTSLYSINLNEGLISIGNNGFSRAKNVTTISFPSTLKSIGDYAFSESTNLREVIFNDGLINIGDMAFSNATYLANFKIPASVETIGQNPFYGNASALTIEVDDSNPFYVTYQSGLYTKDMQTLISYPYGNATSEVVLQEGLKTIGDYAFAYNISITKLTLPISLTAFGKSPFIFSSATMALYYQGTIAQFEQITMDEDEPITYLAYFKDNVVVCSDGDYLL